MAKTRRASRQKKMRGGGSGLLITSWTIKPNKGAEQKNQNLNNFTNFLEDKGYDTEKIESTGTLGSKVEEHVAAAGYTKNDRVPKLVPDLTAVEVEFDNDNTPAVKPLVMTFILTGETNDGKALPKIKLTITAEFDLQLSGGGKKKTRARRRRA